MAIINQPPISNEPSLDIWRYELTNAINDLDSRIKAVLDVVDEDDDIEGLEELLAEYLAIVEMLSSGRIYIQDNEPSPVYSDKFLWIQTNVNDDGDFSFWFCDGS